MSVNHAESYLYLKTLYQKSPWSIFSKLWTPLMGYSPEKFEVLEGTTPMTTLKETVILIATYYFVVFAGREIMRDRPAFKLNDAFLLHNFCLTAISGALLALFLEQLVPTLWNYGVFHTICGAGGWTPQLTTLYYLNYLTKYVELLDTVFLVLKKKPLTFLHTYHHGATAFLCYTQLVGHTPVSWVPITLNLMVHVVMYWYYFQSARGIRVSWKEWITRLQITQFVLDLGFIYFATYNYFASAYMPTLPHIGTCAGEEYAAVTGCVILSSYLLLFISFYFATYKKAGKTGKTGKTAKAAAKRAVVNLETKRVPDFSETSDMASEAAHGAMEAMNETLKAAHIIGN